MSHIHEVHRSVDGSYRCKACGLKMDDLTQVASHVVVNQFVERKEREWKPQP